MDDDEVEYEVELLSPNKIVHLPNVNLGTIRHQLHGPEELLEELLIYEVGSNNSNQINVDICTKGIGILKWVNKMPIGVCTRKSILRKLNNITYHHDHIRQFPWAQG